MNHDPNPPRPTEEDFYSAQRQQRYEQCGVNPPHPVYGPLDAPTYGTSPAVPASQYVQAYPPKKSNTPKVLLIVGLCMLLLCGGIGACSVLGIGAVVNEQGKRATDVTVTSCTGKPNQFGNMIEVGYKIKNSGSTKYTYAMTFVADDATGRRLGEGGALAVDLGPGQETAGSATINTADPAAPVSGKLSCKLSGSV